MKLTDIDKLYISQPMSYDERIQLLKALQEQSFIKGIDKGTLLERDTVTKLDNLKKRIMRKDFYSLMDRLDDYIQDGIRKNKREKYKGRYKYPKKRKDGSKGIVRSSKPQVLYRQPNLPSWLT